MPTTEPETVDDERIQHVCSLVAEAEAWLSDVIDRLADAVDQRRATLTTDNAVCGWCGTVVAVHPWGAIVDHGGSRGCAGNGTRPDDHREVPWRPRR